MSVSLGPHSAPRGIGDVALYHEGDYDLSPALERDDQAANQSNRKFDGPTWQAADCDLAGLNSGTV
jgi:hypothetical protein